MRSPAFVCTLAAVALPVAAASADDPFLRRTATVQAVERVGPAVVNITTERVVQTSSPFRPFFRGDAFFDRFFQDFFEPRGPSTAQSLGSGVLIDAERHVLTNEHVVARARRIRVALADGREFEATLVGADPNNDLAVLKVGTQERLPWIAPGSSADLLVGEPVIAIGNPFGLSNTVTTGVLSALDRSLRAQERVYHGFLQTDASINPGNSGGPLLNAEGELVGINTAIYSEAQGIGFAIPIDVAKRVVAELIEHGEVAPVWLGLQLQDLDPRLLEALGIPDRTTGALVAGVAKGSPAVGRGVRRGDVVRAVDDHEIRSAREFFEILERSTDDQELTLILLREGRRREARIRVKEIPVEVVEEMAVRLLGVTLEPRPRGGFSVSTVRSGSGAEQIGIRPGDGLIRINGRALADAEALRRSVLDLRGRSRALLVVQRGRGLYHVTVPLV